MIAPRIKRKQYSINQSAKLWQVNKFEIQIVWFSKFHQFNCSVRSGSKISRELLFNIIHFFYFVNRRLCICKQKVINIFLILKLCKQKVIKHLSYSKTLNTNKKHYGKNEPNSPNGCKSTSLKFKQFGFGGLLLTVHLGLLGTCNGAFQFYYLYIYFLMF